MCVCGEGGAKDLECGATAKDGAWHGGSHCRHYGIPFNGRWPGEDICPPVGKLMDPLLRNTPLAVVLAGVTDCAAASHPPRA